MRPSAAGANGRTESPVVYVLNSSFILVKLECHAVR
jgi:hypothetical protein